MASNRTTRAVAREDLRQINQQAVFTAIHERGPISRGQIARELRLSPAAVTDITGPMVGAGLVYEAEQGVTSGAGRKPILLRLNYDYSLALGTKISNASVTTALTNLESRVLDWRTDRLTALDVPAVLRAVCESVERLCRDNGVKRERIAGVGVNLPGIVESLTGEVRSSPLLGWNRVPFAGLIEERLGVPALAENDVNALAAAAAWFGPGRGHADFLLLTLGRGVGLGIVLGGQVYRGYGGGAGEFGHTIIDRRRAEDPADPDGTPYRPGTVESLLSDSALLARARELGVKDADSVDDLLDRAVSGHPGALAVYREAGEILGIALANLVNLFAPSLILLGGEGTRAASLLLPSARESLLAHAFCDLGERVEIKVHSWGDEVWAQGAAGLVASRYLRERAPFLGGDPKPEPAPVEPS